jgi:hypothetical protein
MKKIIYAALLAALSLACGNTNSENSSVETEILSSSNEDYYHIKYSINGAEKEKKKTYKTERVKAVYLKSLNDNPAPAVYLQFPTFTETFVLNVQAEKPGTYKVPHIDLHKEDLSFSFGVSENGEAYQLAFEAENVEVKIESIELKANPEAKTSMGDPADGYANLKGTFKGTFFMEKRGKDYRMTPGEGPKGDKVEVSGEFMSGGNF